MPLRYIVVNRLVIRLRWARAARAWRLCFAWGRGWLTTGTWCIICGSALRRCYMLVVSVCSGKLRPRGKSWQWRVQSGTWPAARRRVVAVGPPTRALRAQPKRNWGLRAEGREKESWARPCRGELGRPFLFPKWISSSIPEKSR